MQALLGTHSLSNFTLATIIYRVITGATIFAFGVLFAAAEPTTGAALVFHDRAGMFYPLYIGALIVSGLIIMLHWRLRYWFFVGFTTPLWGYFAISVYAVVIGRISFQGITLFVSMTALWILLLSILRDEIGGAQWN